MAWRAASYSAWNAASSVNQRRSVRSPTPQMAAACVIVGSDKSAKMACSRTAEVLAPWPADADFRSSAVTCGRLGRFGGIAELRSGARCDAGASQNQMFS